MSTEFTIIPCEQRHLEAIRAIFNEAIENSTALYDYHPRSAETVEAWFAAKLKGDFPVLVMENNDGKLMGFASYGVFRGWPAYKYSVEHSVYVDSKFRGRGVGRDLMRSLIKAATGQGYHMMIGGIDAANTASIGLHKSLGFSHCASIKQAGFKFGRWLDLEFYQLILPAPSDPQDG